MDNWEHADWHPPKNDWNWSKTVVLLAIVIFLGAFYYGLFELISLV